MALFLLILGIISAVLIIFWIIVCAVFLKIAIRRLPRRKNTEFPPNSSRARYKKDFDNFKNWYAKQDVKLEYTESFDGLKLCTQILEHENSKKVILMMHGFRAQDHDDFTGSVKRFYDAGYNVILPHQRAHERSEGKYLTYGFKESSDCKKWIEFAVNRYGDDCEIVAYGVSMGCATVCMSLILDLPKNVKCAIADCGYSDAKSIFAYVLGMDYHLPKFPILNFVNLTCQKFAGFKFSDVSPKNALKQNKIPVLFIHGDKDKFVPLKMGIENYENCASEKDIIIVEGATHALSFLVAPEKCWNKVEEFTGKYMKN